MSVQSTTAYRTPWLKVTNILQIKYNGEWVSLPDPQSMKINNYDLDSGDGTGRNQNGELLRDRVAVKEKLEITFPPMMRADYQGILNMVKDTFFTVKYYSDYYGEVREATMYVGDRQVQLYYMQDQTNPSEGWTNAISMNFIER